MSCDLTLTVHTAAYRPGARQVPHEHAELHFSLLLAGSVAETVGRVTESAGPLSVVAKEAGVIHANDFGPEGARLARLAVGAESLGTLLGDARGHEAWRWTHDARVARPFLRLVQRVGDSGHEVAGDDPDVLDLLAAFTARRVAPSHGDPPLWLQDAMGHLREGWQPGLRVSAVARRAGVHPVYLARCIRRWYGVAVGDVMRATRLRVAASAVAAARGTMSDVAHAHGFADEAHFCRTFRDAVGITPGGYRRLLNRLAS